MPRRHPVRSGTLLAGAAGCCSENRSGRGATEPLIEQFDGSLQLVVVLLAELQTLVGLKDDIGDDAVRDRLRVTAVADPRPVGREVAQRGDMQPGAVGHVDTRL